MSNRRLDRREQRRADAIVRQAAFDAEVRAWVARNVVADDPAPTPLPARWSGDLAAMAAGAVVFDMAWNEVQRTADDAATALDDIRASITAYNLGLAASPPPSATPCFRDALERLRDHARALLALAEHMDAHPPVDEAQVEALADEIVQAQSPGYPDATDLARRLLATGRIEVRP